MLGGGDANNDGGAEAELRMGDRWCDDGDALGRKERGVTARRPQQRNRGGGAEALQRNSGAERG